MLETIILVVVTNWAQETNYVATATVHATPSAGQVAEEVGSGLGHATRVSPATVSLGY